jgi:hypothetical protein
MAPKQVLLIALVVVNHPVYRLLFRLIFRDVLKSEDARSAGKGHRPGLGRLLDPGFLKDSGGEPKLFLLLIACALIVLAEYLIVLGLFPALRDAATISGL